jgi:hypothetical protein
VRRYACCHAADPPPGKNAAQSAGSTLRLKLGVKTYAEAVGLAYRTGMLPQSPIDPVPTKLYELAQRLGTAGEVLANDTDEELLKLYGELGAITAELYELRDTMTGEQS